MSTLCRSSSSHSARSNSSSSPTFHSSLKRKSSDDHGSDERSDDDGHYPNGRKKKTKAVTPYHAWGKEVARLCNPFQSVGQCVFNYRQVKQHKKGLDALNKYEKQAHDTYYLIKEHNDEFHVLILEHSPDSIEIKEMIKEMNAGQTQARDADTHVLKRLVIEMVRQLYPDRSAELSGLQPNSKANRGFKNPLTGRLLCPCDLSWDDPDVQNKLIAAPSTVSEGEWPTFFYPRDKFNPQDYCKDILRGELLVWAYKAIFLGPSKWHPGTQATVSEVCNAAKHGMTSVTARSIAYIASQVRVALSSVSTNTRTGGAFCVKTFYWKIVEFLEDPLFAEKVEDLVEWWNEQIFPDPHPDEPEPEQNDSLEIMRQQIAAQRQARQEQVQTQDEN